MLEKNQITSKVLHQMTTQVGGDMSMRRKVTNIHILRTENIIIKIWLLQQTISARMNKTKVTNVISVILNTQQEMNFSFIYRTNIVKK
jgi:hypothetical protein